MSYKALHWLANIPARHLPPTPFACCSICAIPTTLGGARRPPALRGKDVAGLDRPFEWRPQQGLNALEAAKLIRRRRIWNPDGIRGQTYYILGCDRDWHERHPHKMEMVSGLETPGKACG